MSLIPASFSSFLKRRETVYPANGDPASVDDPTTWTSFDNALAAHKPGGFDGIGCVLTSNRGIVGFDLDNCVSDGGGIDTWAASIVERLDTYCEISPSGHGLRLLAYGELPPKGRHAGAFECYSSKRYLTFTGDVRGNVKPLAEQQETIDQIHREQFPKVYPLASRMKSNTRSPIMMHVTLVFAWVTVGMMEASAI